MPDPALREPADDQPIRRDHFRHDGVARGTSRMEAFADGVFAIAFTLPVVEIVMPRGGAGFGGRLLDLWPPYLSGGHLVLRASAAHPRVRDGQAPPVEGEEAILASGD